MKDLPQDFIDWCTEKGISLDHPDDWELWWDCWNTALLSADNTYLESIGQEPIVL